ncbi:MAG: hypothetical protein GX162_12855 [Firmicutes bacterium]|jgi:hypothetical protein|nr:hypothetical protein [Bacillota bacterium]
MGKRRILSSIVLLIPLLLSATASALDVGGEAKIHWALLLDSQGSWDSELTESLRLELFVPPIGGNELRYEFLLTRPLQGILSAEETSYFPRKLYLKRKLGKVSLTLGRQPISWSFGSLLNPVDYTLGAMALEEERSSKFTDAVAVYLPLNWNSGIDLAASFPAGCSSGIEQMKWGLRTRFGVRGYDVTLNYVEEPPISAVIPRQRVGLTLKGDVGRVGVYAAAGVYFDGEKDHGRSYVAGADWSYRLSHYTRLTVQLEYLSLGQDLVFPVLGLLPETSDSTEHTSLLAGRVGYPLDEFSSLALVALCDLKHGGVFISPSYRSILPGNRDLVVSAAVFIGEKDSLFAPGTLLPRATASVGMSYAF